MLKNTWENLLKLYANTAPFIEANDPHGTKVQLYVLTHLVKKEGLM